MSVTGASFNRFSSRLPSRSKQASKEASKLPRYSIHLAAAPVNRKSKSKREERRSTYRPSGPAAACKNKARARASSAELGHARSTRAPESKVGAVHLSLSLYPKRDYSAGCNIKAYPRQARPLEKTKSERKWKRRGGGKDYNCLGAPGGCVYIHYAPLRSERRSKRRRTDRPKSLPHLPLAY